MTDFSDEIIELQSRILFQDDIIQKLDDVIVQQAERLDYLIRRVNELDEKLEQISINQDRPGTHTDEKPPHY